jgi:hypothetical protein
MRRRRDWKRESSRRRNQSVPVGTRRRTSSKKLKMKVKWVAGGSASGVSGWTTKQQGNN